VSDDKQQQPSNPRAATDAVMNEAGVMPYVDVVTARLREEIDDLRDRALRAQAELENFRKRMRREMEDERKYASMPLLRDLLPVVDNVRRAIAAGEKTPEAAAVVDGFKMVLQQLENVLAQYQARRIEALHQPFDPHYHAAIGQQPSLEFPPNTVILVAQEGYLLHDRVLRPAQVMISKGAD
jgi:molecular chaperone GrpE